MHGGTRRAALAAAAVAFGVFAATSLAGSSTTSDGADHTYHGCYQSNGNVYLIGETGLKNSDCRNGDTEFTFSLRGPIGPQGPAGPQGAQGPTGADGKDGANGKDGLDGKDGVSVVATALPVGDANCEEGGTQFVAGTTTTYACNGAKGEDGVSVVATQLESGDENCPTGGVELVAGTSTAYVCNGAQGPQGPTGPAGSSGGTPAADRYAARYILRIDGQAAGGVNLVDGCAQSAAVVVSSPQNGAQQKHIANPEWEPCTFTFGQDMGVKLWQMVDQRYNATPIAHSVEFVRVDNNTDVQHISCPNAYPTEVDVPALDTASTDTYLITATIQAGACQINPGTNAAVAKPSVLPFSASQAHATIANVGIKGAVRIDAFTLDMPVVVNTQLGGSVQPTVAKVPNLTLRYAKSDATEVSDLQSWFHSFVVQGQSTQSDERSATIELVKGHLSLDFGQTGIFRLDPEERQSDDAYRASLYSETLGVTATP